MKFYDLVSNKDLIATLEDLSRERETWLQRPPFREMSEKLATLPFLEADSCEFSESCIRIGTDRTGPERFVLENALKSMIPWKKGPFKVFGIDIDAEWRSDFKWDRFCHALPDLKDQIILDVGCNNGYYMFRMLPKKPKFILGIDPVPRLWYQFHLLQNFARIPNLEFQMWGWEQLSLWQNLFHTIFCMGILYHHRNPLGILENLRQALKPGGLLVLESIVIPGDDSGCLFPPDRYAMMRNVWFLPTVPSLCHMLSRCGFIDIEVISVNKHEPQEQRSTPWNPGPSYEDFLKPGDPETTVEGHPAPLRVVIFARKR